MKNPSPQIRILRNRCICTQIGRKITQFINNWTSKFLLTFIKKYRLSLMRSTLYSFKKTKKWQLIVTYLKFIYSEKATKFCEISTLDLSYVVTVKSTVEIWQNFVAFSEYMNFTQFVREIVPVTICHTKRANQSVISLEIAWY